MSMRQQPLPPIPAETVRQAKRNFPKGHPYIAFADAFGPVYTHEKFAPLFGPLGQGAISPILLALVCILQSAENLSDRAAADKVRDSVLWKYVLHLPLDHEGFDHSVLSEFRDRLLRNGLETILLEELVRLAAEKGVLKTKKQRTDSTFVLSAARTLSRVELLHETFRMALEVLAGAAPDWLRTILKPEWFDRYEKLGFSNWLPRKEAERIEFAIVIGQDGFYLLDEIDKADRRWLKEMSDIQTLRRVWEEQFHNDRRKLRLKTNDELKPSAERIATPHDTDARFSVKRDVHCTGYKQHVTETYGPGAPRLITNVETTVATTADSVMLPSINRNLMKKGLKPGIHLTDAGYHTEEAIQLARKKGIDVIAPEKNNRGWQAGGAYDIAQFSIDFKSRTATCPQGKRSEYWRDRADRNVHHISFAKEDCSKCPVKLECTKAPSRSIEIKERSVFRSAAKQKARWLNGEVTTEYANRAGIEGTQARLTGELGGRRSPYFGLPKTRLRNLVLGAALNFLRLGEWFFGTPLTSSRTSKFQKLAAA